ncbi:hypothetical protein SAMN05444007_108264 [Cribrihabitans marinus]|uniref:Uncharacterized protein n=1 Tax=Cribrihabitans marinus TaxID=1227549 RepID=A0A1H7CQK2_9RHOB|nr:hypothetical protein [Cribrihabitans marinus]GGH36437.1 hypothetical protein GCM10010973_30360 [Cribrihabitans marinus]SEJ91948.1 hypothetical protein SAMN05444007_108264 [Cribrihabitans marinus]
MAKEKWLTDNLCALGDRVRIERGPQVVELDCTDENLDDRVTPRRYAKGRRDALGRLIQPDEAVAELQGKLQRLGAGEPAEGVVKAIGEITAAKALDDALERPHVAASGKMAVIDDKARHKPWLWKVYQLQAGQEFNHRTGEVQTRERFVKVKELQGLEKALEHARKLAKGD